MLVTRPPTGDETDNPQHLVQVDPYRYDEAWEISPEKIFPLDPDTLVIDLRRQADFREWHFPGAFNITLSSMNASSPSPFFHPNLLHEQWTELEGLFSQSFLQGQFTGRKVLCLCYHGDTARVATSVLRAKGFEAESVRGGHVALLAIKPELESLRITTFSENFSKKTDSVLDEKSDCEVEKSDGEVDRSDCEVDKSDGEVDRSDAEPEIFSQGAESPKPAAHETRLI